MEQGFFPGQAPDHAVQVVDTDHVQALEVPQGAQRLVRQPAEPHVEGGLPGIAGSETQRAQQMGLAGAGGAMQEQAALTLPRHPLQGRQRRSVGASHEVFEAVVAVRLELQW